MLQSKGQQKGFVFVWFFHIICPPTTRNYYFLTEHLLGCEILLKGSFVLKLQNSCWLRKPRLHSPLNQGNCCLMKYCINEENVIKWQYFEHLMTCGSTAGIFGHFRTWNLRETVLSVIYYIWVKSRIICLWSVLFLKWKYEETTQEHRGASMIKMSKNKK